MILCLGWAPAEFLAGHASVTLVKFCFAKHRMANSHTAAKRSINTCASMRWQRIFFDHYVQKGVMKCGIARQNLVFVRSPWLIIPCPAAAIPVRYEWRLMWRLVLLDCYCLCICGNDAWYIISDADCCCLSIYFVRTLTFCVKDVSLWYTLSARCPVRRTFHLGDLFPGS